MLYDSRPHHLHIWHGRNPDSINSISDIDNPTINTIDTIDTINTITITITITNSIDSTSL
jgi:hypothetical protein